MPTTVYHYGPGAYAPQQLTAEIVAAGLIAPVHLNGAGYLGPGTPAVYVDVGFDRALTPTENAVLNGVVEAHVPAGPRRPRVLYAIYEDVGALTASQKTNIGADLFGGTPPKVSQDTGPNAPSLLILWTLRQLGTLSVADKRLIETDAISIYTLDNPSYLVHPTFDPSIDVPGDEPAGDVP